jgi:hypothetical protein
VYLRYGRREMRWRRIWFRILPEGKIVTPYLFLFPPPVKRMGVAACLPSPGMAMPASPAVEGPGLTTEREGMLPRDAVFSSGQG